MWFHGIEIGVAGVVDVALFGRIIISNRKKVSSLESVFVNKHKFYPHEAKKYYSLRIALQLDIAVEEPVAV